MRPITSLIGKRQKKKKTTAKKKTNNNDDNKKAQHWLGRTYDFNKKYICPKLLFPGDYKLEEIACEMQNTHMLFRHFPSV